MSRPHPAPMMTAVTAARASSFFQPARMRRGCRDSDHGVGGAYVSNHIDHSGALTGNRPGALLMRCPLLPVIRVVTVNGGQCPYCGARPGKTLRGGNESNLNCIGSAAITYSRDRCA